MPESNHKASLGCGTLILIALIVLIFGNHQNTDLNRSIQRLSSQINTIEQETNSQSEALKKIESELKSLRADYRNQSEQLEKLITH